METTQLLKRVTFSTNTFVTRTEEMQGTWIVRIKVVDKMISEEKFETGFNWCETEIEVDRGNSIPQTRKSIEIRVLGDISSHNLVNKLMVGCWSRTVGIKWGVIMNIKGKHKDIRSRIIFSSVKIMMWKFSQLATALAKLNTRWYPCASHGSSWNSTCMIRITKFLHKFSVCYLIVTC